MRALKRAAIGRPEDLAVAILVLAGVLLRARGFLWDASSFWLDEASWAMRLFERPFAESWLRPIGFLALSRGLADLFGPSEAVLRLLPWCAGVGAVLLAPGVARRLFTRTAARLVLVATIALCPAAVDLAKEFKPYSVALFLHLGLVALSLRYVEGGGKKALAGALGLALLGSVLSQDVALALPGTFLVLFGAARRRVRAELTLVASAAAVIILAFGVQYLAIWEHRPAGISTDWGTRYDVFHTSDHTESYLSWLAGRALDLAALPTVGRRLWHADWLTPGRLAGVASGYRFVWLWLFAVGLWLIASERRLRAALLLVVPLLVLVVFNAVGLWPLGEFRTNLFCLFYTGSIAAMALDAPWVDRAPRASAGAVLALTIGPLLLFDRDLGAHKRMFTKDSSFVALMEHVARVAPVAPPDRREVVLVDPLSCDIWRYYADFHPTLKRTLGPRLAGAVTFDCLADDAASVDQVAERAVRAGRRGFFAVHASDRRPHGTVTVVRWRAPVELGSHHLEPFERAP